MTASTKLTTGGSAPTTKSTTSPKAIRQKIVLNDEDLVEKFVKGSGPGGQWIRVQCQQTRSLQENRGIARKLLREKLDDLWNGSLSKNAKKSTKIAKQKARNARRAKQKYGTSSSSSSTVDTDITTTTSIKTQTE
ncbi:unnamed protein product [Absidia cylindrospora]